jgi:hypothetical protein
VQRAGEGPQVYDLHAVSCHFGGLGGGHCMWGGPTVGACCAAGLALE